MGATLSHNRCQTFSSGYSYYSKAISKCQAFYKYFLLPNLESFFANAKSVKELRQFTAALPTSKKEFNTSCEQFYTQEANLISVSYDDSITYIFSNFNRFFKNFFNFFYEKAALFSG